jgi:hypothetical protein
MVGRMGKKIVEYMENKMQDFVCSRSGTNKMGLASIL